MLRAARVGESRVCGAPGRVVGSRVRWPRGVGLGGERCAGGRAGLRLARVAGSRLRSPWGAGLTGWRARAGECGLLARRVVSLTRGERAAGWVGLLARQGCGSAGWPGVTGSRCGGHGRGVRPGSGVGWRARAGRVGCRLGGGCWVRVRWPRVGPPGSGWVGSGVPGLLGVGEGVAQFGGSLPTGGRPLGWRWLSSTLPARGPRGRPWFRLPRRVWLPRIRGRRAGRCRVAL